MKLGQARERVDSARRDPLVRSAAVTAWRRDEPAVHDANSFRRHQSRCEFTACHHTLESSDEAAHAAEGTDPSLDSGAGEPNRSFRATVTAPVQEHAPLHALPNRRMQYQQNYREPSDAVQKLFIQIFMRKVSDFPCATRKIFGQRDIRAPHGRKKLKYSGGYLMQGLAVFACFRWNQHSVRKLHVSAHLMSK